MKKVVIGILLFIILGAARCDTDSVRANRNITTAAETFEINRNIVFYSSWTDTELISITGFCSIDDIDQKLWVTCKDKDGFKRHQLGKSANVTYFMTQIESVPVSLYRTRIIWKPESFIPDIDIRTSLQNAENK